MRHLLLASWAGLIAGFALAACSSSAPCVNLVHTACSFGDGGDTCDANSVCIPADAAIDPCPPGASGCCFQACTTDAQCPSGQLCSDDGDGSVCALGRCAED